MNCGTMDRVACGGAGYIYIYIYRAASIHRIIIGVVLHCHTSVLYPPCCSIPDIAAAAAAVLVLFLGSSFRTCHLIKVLNSYINCSPSPIYICHCNAR